MTYLTADRDIYIGRETTNGWGTAVPQTSKLIGITDCSIKPGVDVRVIDDIRSTRFPGYHNLVQNKAPTGTIRGLASYDDLGYWLDGMFNSRYDTDKGATTDAQGGVIRSWVAPAHSSDTEDFVSYTLAYGDGTNIYSLLGATVSKFTLSAKTGVPTEFSAELFGKQVATDTFETLADRAQNFIIGGHWALKMDPGSDAVGTTTVANHAFAFELAIDTQRTPKLHLGNLTADGVKEAAWTGTLKLTVELSATTEPYLDNIISATSDGVAKAVQLLATSGSNTCTISFCGILNGDPSIWTDEDGIQTLELELMGQKTSGNASWLTIGIENDITALP